jgi:hypothetical protein
MSYMRTVHQIVLSDDYLAQTQRLVIQHDRKLRLTYGSWWVWWVPRMALALTMLFLLTHRMAAVVWLPAGFIILSFAGEWSLRRGLAQARKRSRAKGSTMTVIMDAAGVNVSGTLATTDVKWPALRAPVVLSDGVLINLTPTSGLWLPDTCLVEGSAADVRQILAGLSELDRLRAPG